MIFNIKGLPYLPDFSKLINTMLDAVENNVKDIEQSEYLDYLLDSKVLIEKDGFYHYGSEWAFFSTADLNTIYSTFREKLNEVDDLRGIVRFIGTEGKTYEEIISAKNYIVLEQTIRVVLSWMEELEILRIEKGKYYFNDRLEESDEENESSAETLDEIDVKDAHFSFFEYLRKIQDEQIVLNPDFQRHKVWKGVQKSQFIESAILGLPLPPIYFKRDNMSRLVIVDGLQRTTAIQEFMDNQLRLEGLETLKKLNGLTYKDIKNSENLKVYATKLEDNQLYCYILQKSVPMSVVYDIFNRINTGGTKLSRQEIRNCLFLGNSTKLVKRLSENDIFRNAIDNGISKDRMKDREAILRCLAFQILDYETDYLWAMDSFLEKAMRQLNKMSDIQIQDIEHGFLSIMKHLTGVFGNKNFRIYDDYTRGRINIAVMETVYWCMCQLSKKKKQIVNDDLRRRYDKMIHDPNYQFNVRNSTGSKSKVIERFNIAKRYLIPNI